MTTNIKSGVVTEGAPDAASANNDADQMTGRVLSPAARRALAEAEARRQAVRQQAHSGEREIGGRGGADPARYGDWEIDGRAIDF